MHIHLKDLRFRAHHGVFEEERLLGNDFIVQVEVAFQEPGAVRSLSDTLDYSLIYNVVKERMAIATPLLETVAQETAQLIAAIDNRIQTVRVQVIKQQVPIAQFEGATAVTCTVQNN